MERLVSWLKDNWFALLKGAGIVFGLLFTTVTLRRDARGRRRSDALALMQQHRELWSEVHRRRDLNRIFEGTVDLVASPLTVAEQEYPNLVIVHFHTGWQLAQEGTVLTLKTLGADARSFFSLPIPKFVWGQTKASRDPKFVEFIEQCLRN